MAIKLPVGVSGRTGWGNFAWRFVDAEGATIFPDGHSEHEIAAALNGAPVHAERARIAARLEEHAEDVQRYLDAGYTNFSWLPQRLRELADELRTVPTP